jgi:hypothetical protein
MHRLTVTAALVLLLSGSVAFAQSGADSKPYPMQSAQGKGGKGTKQEKDACFRDANRYCADEIPEGDMQVLACLRTHRTKLSKGCEKVLAEHGQ